MYVYVCTYVGFQIAKQIYSMLFYSVLKRGITLYVNKNTLWKDYYNLLLLHTGEDYTNTVTHVRSMLRMLTKYTVYFCGD